jgi:uncharacterized RDD family membrane protein YckC
MSAASAPSANDLNACGHRRPVHLLGQLPLSGDIGALDSRTPGRLGAISQDLNQELQWHQDGPFYPVRMRRIPCVTSVVMDTGGMPQPNRMAFSDPWRRNKALLLDLLIVFPLPVIAGFLITSVAQAVALVVVEFVFVIGYFAVLVASPWQATVGQRRLGMVVTTVDGSRVGPARAVIRSVCKLVFSNLLYLAVFLTPERQAIHDLIARTVVVDRPTLGRQGRRHGGSNM